MTRLSPRLLTLANNVPNGAKVADIGTDHAYLPIYLMEQEIAAQAVGSELNPGPYQAALKAVAMAGLKELIDVRNGNGLETIEPGEVDTVVIAGMGAGTIIEILTNRPKVVAQLRRLVLQPMIGSAQLRKWLGEAGWQIIKEDLVEDDHRIYEVIVAEPGQEQVTDDIEFELGPRLLEQGHPLMQRHLQRLIDGEEKILQQLSRSNQPEAQNKAREITAKLERMREVVRCRLQLEI